MSVKKNVPVVREKTTELVESKTLFTGDLGLGFEGVTPTDVAIPFLTILQSLSPQIKKGSVNRVEGAEEGDIFQTVSGQVFKQAQGLALVPCAFRKAYVEWTPREMGGGYVREHADSSALKDCRRDDRNNDVLPNGNYIVETAYHYCVLVNGSTFERVVLGMARTQLKKSRRWNSQMMSLQVLVNGKRVMPPPFSHVYPVTTALEQKDQNSWYNWSIGTPRLIDDPELYGFARHFYQEVKAGQVKVQAPPTEVEGAETTGAEHF